MNEDKIDNKDLNNSGFEVIKIVVDVVAIIISVTALIVSIWAVHSDNFNDRAISDNEIKQAHVPVLKIWNQEIDVEVQNQSIISDELRLAYSNIGDGIAQDIKFEISPEEQRNIAIQCEKILDSCLDDPYNAIPDADGFSHSHFLSPDVLKDTYYSFHYEKPNLSGKLQFVSTSDGFYSIDSIVADSRAYLVPVNENDTDIDFLMPKELTLLIYSTLATANYHEMVLQKPISIVANLSYKDIYDNQIDDKITLEIGIIEDGESKTDDNEEDEYTFKLRLQVIAKTL